MSIHRFFKRQFPLRSRITGVAFLFFILLFSGCGGDEHITNPISESTGSEHPAPQPSNYFPMTFGSRWVYRYPDGSEHTREVLSREITYARKVGSYFYHFLRYKPPDEDNRFDFLKTPAYTQRTDRILLLVKYNEIHHTVWNTIENSLEKSNKPLSEGGESLLVLYVAKLRVADISNLVLLPLPLVPDQTWKALQITLSGKTDLRSLVHSFETKWVISGRSGAPESVVTPAGTFEDCLKIQYEVAQQPLETKEFRDVEEDLLGREFLLNREEKDVTLEMTALFSAVTPRLHLQTVWLAPGVGAVKIETPNGIAELIDYDIK